MWTFLGHGVQRILGFRVMVRFRLSCRSGASATSFDDVIERR